MDIAGWNRKLEGAEPDGWCAPGVCCEACTKTYQIRVVEILKVRRPEATYYYNVCMECQTAKLEIKW